MPSSSTATLAYVVKQTNVLQATLATAMLAVPYDPDILSMLGVYVNTDVTSVSVPGQVTRTTTLKLVPATAATIVASLYPGLPSGSPVWKLTITNPGATYVRPPVLSIAPPPGEAATQAFATCTLDIHALAVGAGGTGYSASTTIEFSGGGGSGAVATPTINGFGTITALTIVNRGSGYTSVPTVTAVDPTGSGSGASLSATMQVGAVDLINPGSGYEVAPVVTVTPWFKSLFPDNPPAQSIAENLYANQEKPFYNMLTAALRQALSCPVIAQPPIIT